MISINKIESTYRRLKSEGRNILRLYSGNPNECGFRFPPEILERAYSDYFQSQRYDPHPKGAIRARQAIHDYYARHGAVVNPDNILLTSGTSESFFYLFSLLAGGKGGNILTPNPSYPLFDHIAGLAGVELRHYPLREEHAWSIDLEALRQRTDERTRAIVLVSPNNPTGAVAMPDEIREVVSWANQRNIALICDEVFSEFYFGPGDFPRVMAVSSPRLCFTLNGLSKMFALPGMKLSWIAVTGDSSLVCPAVDQLETTADTFLSCHTPIQEALPAILLEGQAFLKDYREEVRGRRDLAIEVLREIPCLRFVEPQGGYYLMAEVIAPRVSEEELVIRLMEEDGIFAHPGYFYDYESGVHVVISFLGAAKDVYARLAQSPRLTSW